MCSLIVNEEGYFKKDKEHGNLHVSICDKSDLSGAINFALFLNIGERPELLPIHNLTEVSDEPLTKIGNFG